MNKKALSIFALAGIFFGITSAHAYKMSGIDGYFKVTQGTEVTLKDEKGQPLVIKDGNYRLRLSNASKTINFMESDSHLQAVKLPNGFPGGDLRNFTIAPSRSNQDVTIVGKTEDVVSNESTYEVYESCRYACGHDVICTGRDGDRCRVVTQYCTGRERKEVTEVTVERIFTMTLEDASGQNAAEFEGVVQTSRNRTREHVLSSCY